FEALPAPFDFTLDVKPQSGTAPLLVNTRYGTFVGVRIRGLLTIIDGFRVLQNGQVVRIANSETGFAHRFDDAGKFVIEGAAQGVGRDGYARVVRTVTVDVKGKPQPVPPEPAPNLAISVTGDGNGTFTVNGTGFLPNKSVFIRIVDKDDPFTKAVFLEDTTTPQGTFEFKTGNVCALGGPQLVFSAHDGRLKDGQEIYSNFVTKSCPA
ncbi:MAG: hypothetical protein ACRDTT_31615, partial [Pseudonocardiaceae bacterium]